MFNLNPTSLEVHDMRIAEQLAKAERRHELTRGESVADKRLVQRPSIQLPRISLIRRLMHALPRPA